ncbi:GNAT family N-acetyltransferase [Streptomyces sp. NPDC008086]|uniref:GNAT family N-acetyltransferase n=1 Tax=Streptomyces sp. NPDC008086 TaxID=3364807 RepID=UPI0036EACD1D
MQSWIRAEARKECSGRLDERVLVADSAEPACLAAVAAHARCDTAYMAWVREQVQWDGPVRILRAVAVDVRYQGQGLGRVAMEHALDDIIDREHEEATLVLALIHEGNERSQRMAASLDFELAPFPCEDEPAMNFWFGDV